MLLVVSEWYVCACGCVVCMFVHLRVFVFVCLRICVFVFLRVRVRVILLVKESTY